MGIQISVEISSCKEEAWYYLLYTLVYTLVIQNTGSNKEKQKLSQISQFTTSLKGLSLINCFGGYWWWRRNSLTHRSQIYSDSDIAQLFHSKYAKVHGHCLLWNQCQRFPIQYRGGHKPLSLTIQGIFMYLNLFHTAVLVVLIPPQNIFKMFSPI